MQQDEQPKNLSRHQYGSLRFIHTNKVTMAYLRHAHANTLGSLAYRGYLQRHGSGEEAIISLTPSGEAALRAYAQGSLNERAHEGELTERCQRLLKHVRRNVVSMAS